MLKPGQVLQLVVIALLGLAVVMVQSASLSIGSTFHPLAMLVNQQALYAALAVLALLCASRLPVRGLLNRRGWANPVIWALAVALLLVVATLIPHNPLRVVLNGAHRWLLLAKVGAHRITFQPSELVKWVIILAIAIWCARRGAAVRQFTYGLLPALALVGVACGLIVIDDLGTAALVGVVACVLLIAGGARIWQMALMAMPAAGAVVLAIAHSPYRRARLTSFLNPWADPRGTGYQAIQSMIAIAQGGPAGKGLGNGIQKFGYLPTDTSDCLFAIICEELGLPGAALVIGLYLVLIWVGLLIARDCKDMFSRLVALGVILTVGLQATINLAVVTVVVPTKGIALPLLSAGGTGWIVTAAALGLVAAIDRANQQDALPALAERATEPAALSAAPAM